MRSTVAMSVRSHSFGFTPKRISVSAISAYVLPNMWRDDTMFLPAAATASNVLLMAAMPELKAMTFSAPVSAFTLFSKKVTVGLVTRE